MSNNTSKYILIFGLLLLLISCNNQETKICASKVAEEELIKKATEQGLIPKAYAKKIKFTIFSVEESKVAANSQDGNSAKITTNRVLLC